MNTSKPLITVSQILLTLSLTLFIISAAVVLTLNFRPLYYMDIQLLSISETSGLDVAEIKDNYDALIDYNSMFNHDELQFPTLAMSEGGRIHFVEVKRIFVAVQYLFVFTLLLSAAGIFWMHKKKEGHYLKWTSILTIALPTVLGIIIALNWDRFFVTFHQIFFNNDYWIFDSLTDPVITILPDTFFLHCAVMILALVLLGSGLCGFIYHRRKAA